MVKGDSMAFNSPLRYPGGKGKLTKFFKLIFEQNDLLDGHYVEAYAGGAGIAINLLLHEYASCIHLNDLNYAVYAFWQAILDTPDELCQLISDTEVSMSTWHLQKKIISNPESHSPIEIAFAAFYLNRTNRSGIILGGAIGGKNQEGKWKINARFNKSDLIARINKIALYRSRIRLYNLDAAKLLTDVLPMLPKKSLIYFDPPYFIKGQELYQDHYQPSDHKRLSRLIRKQIAHHWIVSYDPAPEIMKMYNGYPMIEYGINYSAQNKYRGSEVMFFSNKLLIPDITPTPLLRG